MAGVRASLGRHGDAVQVRALGGDEVADRVAAELLARGAGELEGDRRLATTASASTAATSLRSTSASPARPSRGRPSGAGASASAAASSPRGRRSPRRSRRPPRSRPRGSSAAKPAVVDLVVRLRAAHAREREAVADLDALDGLDAHHGSREARVEPILLRRVRPQAGRDAGRAHLDDPADRVAIRRASSTARAAPSSPATDDRDLDPDRARAAPSPPHRRPRAPPYAALARSSASRTSSRPYLSTPARSACPAVGASPAVPFPWARPRRPRAHPPRPVRVVAVWTTSASGVRASARGGDPRAPRLRRCSIAGAASAVALLAARGGRRRSPRGRGRARREPGDDRDERGTVRLAWCRQRQCSALERGAVARRAPRRRA